MAQLLNVSIDVSKIDKSKLIKGKKGTYLNLTVAVNDEKDNYDNDCSAWQSQTKEEREAGNLKNYLGNGRVIWNGTTTKTEPTNTVVTEEDDQLPF